MKSIFRTVLIPHDFSTHANRALQLAAALVPTPQKLIVLHVTPRFGNPLVRARVLRDAQRRLRAAVSRVSGRGRVSRIEQRVVAGNPYEQIARAATRADSIVMCTAGRTGLRHLVIGSVAEKVVRHAPVPVLTFRPAVRVGRHARTHATSRRHDRARTSRRRS